jgi:hypothetical protein
MALSYWMDCKLKPLKTIATSLIGPFHTKCVDKFLARQPRNHLICHKLNVGFKSHHLINFLENLWVSLSYSAQVRVSTSDGSNHRPNRVLPVNKNWVLSCINSPVNYIWNESYEGCVIWSSWLRFNEKPMLLGWLKKTKVSMHYPWELWLNPVNLKLSGGILFPNT